MQKSTISAWIVRQFTKYSGSAIKREEERDTPEQNNTSKRPDGKIFAESFEDAALRAQYWETIDPFPDIPPTLLNSADISDYIRVTGMIYPFHPEDLRGATYSVRLGGMCIYYEEEETEGEPREHIVCIGKDAPDMPHAQENHSWLTIKDNLELKPNSITFLTLEPVFHVPEYMAFRFNLKIPHVYKGLLLGTGPIVDPGFKGRLSIPLHNLTSNKYILSKGDEIISLEVTKMSPVQFYNIKVKERLGKYTAMDIPPYRQVYEYIDRALEKTDGDSIVSSVAAATNEAKGKAEEAVRKVLLYRNIGIAGILSLVIAVIAAIVSLLLPSYQLIKSVADTQTSYECQIKDLKDQIANLEEQLGISTTAQTEDEFADAD